MAAEMRFEHEFTVAVPLVQVWHALSRPEALAASLPGAQLRAVDGVHTGRIELDTSRGLACMATITAVDQDDDEHVATMSVHGRQLEGPAIGSAILRSRLTGDGSSTRVRLTAEVQTTGHAPGSGFGAGARRLFEAVAERLEREAKKRPASTAPAARAEATSREPASPATARPAPAADAWLARAGAQKRLVGGGAGLVIAVLVLRRMRRRY